MAEYPISGKPMPEINLRHITIAEWRALFDRTQPDHDGDMTLSKVSGITVEEIQVLPMYDYRALVQAVIEKSGQPLENDPKN
jgi:hypothetical protein